MSGSCSSSVSLACPPVARQVPGETSPAVSWVFPLLQLLLVRNLWSVSDVGGLHSSTPRGPCAPLRTFAETFNQQQVLVYVLLPQLFTFIASVLQEHSFVTVGFLFFLRELTTR